MKTRTVKLSGALIGCLVLFFACQSRTNIGPDSSGLQNGPAASSTATGGQAGQVTGGSGGSLIDEPDASDGKDAPTDTTVDADLPDLTAGLPGPKMVRVFTPNGKSYYIDTTEVTQAHYQEFLAQVENNTEFQPELRPFCKDNNGYRPVEGVSTDDTWFACAPGTFSPKEKPDYPMGCVDFCDAQAYCIWAGKRLCGGVGGATLSGLDDFKNANLDEWYNACSNGGKTLYPYGDEFDPNKCNTKLSGSGVEAQTIAESEASSCKGIISPFDQIVNMSGNVIEWQDYCEPYPSQPNQYSCAVRGDDSSYTAVSLQNGGLLCGHIAAQNVIYGESPGPMNGFRCCHDGP